MSAETSWLDRIGSELARLFGWAWRETAALLPENLAGLGTRQRAALIPLDSDGEPGVAGGARQSWLGTWRHGGTPRTGGAGAAIVTLHPDHVLRRTLTLSKLAARRPEAAARIKARALSPIKLDDAVIAIEALGPTEEGGARMEIAIARRRDLEAAVNVAEARSAGTWRVAADFDGAGPRFVFDAGSPKRAASPVLMIIVTALAGLAAISAFEARLTRDVAAYEDQRDALRVEARAMRAGGGTQAAMMRAERYFRLDEGLRAIADLPAEAVPQDIRVDSRRLMVETDEGRVERDLPRGRPAVVTERSDDVGEGDAR